MKHKNILSSIIFLSLAISLTGCGSFNQPEVHNGESGQGLYEEYIKYHPDYHGDEEQFYRDYQNGVLGNKEYCKVSFDTQGHGEIEPVKIRKGDSGIREPLLEYDPNILEVNWTCDGEPFDFRNTKVYCDITLVANFKKRESLVFINEVLRQLRPLTFEFGHVLVEQDLKVYYPTAEVPTLYYNNEEVEYPFTLTEDQTHLYTYTFKEEPDFNAKVLVTFDTNGGNETFNSVHAHPMDIDLGRYVPTKKGYTFLYWGDKNNNCEEVEWIDKSYDLIAVYEKEVYQIEIIYNFQGDSRFQECEYDEVIKLTHQEDEIVKFLYYIDDKGVKATDYYHVTYPTTLKAVYEDKAFTLTFDSGTDVKIDPIVVRYGEYIKVMDIPMPSIPHHKFIGWQSQGKISRRYLLDENIWPEADMSFKAIFITDHPFFVTEYNREDNTCDIIDIGSDYKDVDYINRVITIPNYIGGIRVRGVKSIGDIGSYGWYKCDKLIISEGIEYFNCDSRDFKIGELVVPSSVRFISSNVNYRNDQRGEYAVDKITIAKDSKYYKQIDGTQTIVTLVGNMMFDKVSMRNSLFKIDPNATSLPNDINYISSYACKALKTSSIDIPESVIAVYYNAFGGNQNIKHVNFKGELKYIASCVFENCENLESVKFVKPVSLVGEYAFKNCNKLITIDIGQIKEMQREAFLNCISLNEIALNKDLTVIPRSCFDGCANLTKVSGGENVNFIDQTAFNKCSKLTSFAFSETLTKIEDGAFYGCTSLSEVYLGAKFDYLSHSAFIYCNGINKVTVNKDNFRFTTYGGTSLYEYNNNHSAGTLRLYTGKEDISNHCDRIGEFSMTTLKNVKSLIITNSVTKIDAYSFLMVKDLEYLFIPTSVVSIGIYAFKGCYNLTLHMQASFFTPTSSDWNKVDDTSTLEVLYNQTPIAI